MFPRRAWCVNSEFPYYARYVISGFPYCAWCVTSGYISQSCVMCNFRLYFSSCAWCVTSGYVSCLFDMFNVKLHLCFPNCMWCVTSVSLLNSVLKIIRCFRVRCFRHIQGKWCVCRIQLACISQNTNEFGVVSLRCQRPVRHSVVATRPQTESEIFQCSKAAIFQERITKEERFRSCK